MAASYCSIRSGHCGQYIRKLCSCRLDNKTFHCHFYSSMNLSSPLLIHVQRNTDTFASRNFDRRCKPFALKEDTCAFTPLHYYSSHQSTTRSKWAIVRLVQKGGELTEKILYRISPKLHGFYKQFIDGGKFFVQDVRFMYRLRKRMKKENIQLRELPWKDIYTKDKVSHDMGKVIPTMIVTWLPFAFYVMLPLIFTFPRQFLSDHFLNKQQLSEFQRKSLKLKFVQEQKIWKLIQETFTPSPAVSPNSLSDNPVRECNGLEIQEVMRARPLFEDQLSLDKLPRNHLVALCKLHSLLTFLLPSPFLRKRLQGKCTVLQGIDFALRRDGTKELTERDLQKLCYQRVFPTSGVSSVTMQMCLASWLQTSENLKDSEVSLYLHLSLFKTKSQKG